MLCCLLNNSIPIVLKDWSCKMLHFGTMYPQNKKRVRVYMQYFHYIHPTQRTVSRTKVGVIRSGKQNPVPVKLIKINLERPHTALGNLGIVFLGANPVNCSSLHTTSPATFLDVNLKIWTLNIAGNMNTSQ